MDRKNDDVHKSTYTSSKGLETITQEFTKGKLCDIAILQVLQNTNSLVSPLRETLPSWRKFKSGVIWGMAKPIMPFLISFC